MNVLLSIETFETSIFPLKPSFFHCNHHCPIKTFIFSLKKPYEKLPGASLLGDPSEQCQLTSQLGGEKQYPSAQGVAGWGRSLNLPENWGEWRL
jgi:hypothetical protein